jgi:hyperosmotically inducible periplasmic protein
MTTRVLLASLMAASLGLIACERNPTSTSTPSANRPAPAAPAPDNTANNKPDRNMDSTKTPEDQSNAQENVELTAAIRRAIVQDDAMSVNAKNIKIVTDKAGMVTLRGVVDSQAEKDLIEQKAKGITGVTSVTNNLEVKAP